MPQGRSVFCLCARLLECDWRRPNDISNELTRRWMKTSMSCQNGNFSTGPNLSKLAIRALSVEYVSFSK